MNGGNLRPIVLPKFMSTPETFGETGYQKAHQLYDEMRRFFARKALAEYQNDGCYQVHHDVIKARL